MKFIPEGTWGCWIELGRIQPERGFCFARRAPDKRGVWRLLRSPNGIVVAKWLCDIEVSPIVPRACPSGGLLFAHADRLPSPGTLRILDHYEPNPDYRRPGERQASAEARGPAKAKAGKRAPRGTLGEVRWPAPARFPGEKRNPRKSQDNQALFGWYPEFHRAAGESG